MSKRFFTTLFIIVFADMLGLGIISPLMPLYSQELGASGLWLGIIFGAMSLSRIIFLPTVGRMSDRWGRKVFISIGLFAYVFLALAYTGASNVYHLTGIRLCQGILSAMVVPVAQAYIGELSPSGEEGRYMGTFHIAFFVGMGSGPLIGGVLKDSFGFDYVFYAMSGLFAFALMLALVFLPEQKKRDQTSKRESVSFKKILSNRMMRAVFLFRAIVAFGRAPIMVYLPIYARGIGISITRIGILVASSTLLSGVLQGFTGKLADRYPKVLLIVLGGLAGYIPFLFIPLSSTFNGLLFLKIIIGIGGAISMPALSAIAVQVGKEHGMGSTIGVYNMAMSLGFVTSPLISGIIMDNIALNWVFYLGGTISIVGIIIFYWMLRSPKEDS